MSEKKIQVMTPKKFVKAKLSGKITAEGFLAAHREFLNNHSFLNPILEAYDNKELLPTPTLQACQAALFEHVIACEVKTAESKIEKAKERSTKIIRKGENGEEKSNLPAPATDGYTVTIMVKVQTREGVITGEEVGTVETFKDEDVVKDGEVTTTRVREVKPAVFNLKDYGSAERKADRCLYSMANSLYATIENNVGVKVITTVHRADAIARISKGKKGAVSKERGKSTKTLGFGVKCKNDTASFSRG